MTRTRTSAMVVAALVIALGVFASTASTQAADENPGITKQFFAATDNAVTWKLTPKSGAEYQVWDSSATGCTEFGGASCGSIASGGAGKFSPSPKAGSQYLLVTQPYTMDAGKCEVVNRAKWKSQGNEGQVQATYKCSGATAFGWPLLAIAFVAAVAVAGVAFGHRAREH